MQECKEYIKKGVGLDGAAGTQVRKFGWHPSTPGDGVRQSIFICKSHKDYAYVVRGVKLGCTFWVQIDAGQEHTKELQVKMRKNARLTNDQQEAVMQLIDSGAKPSAILSVLTSKELERCAQAKQTPLKRASGGLAGVCAALQDVRQAPSTGYT